MTIVLSSCRKPAWRAGRLPRFARALIRDEVAASVMEFALILPILMTLGMYGVELTYMAATNLEISQIALSVADNASRLEQTNNSSVTPTVTEADVNSVMTGALDEGQGISFKTNGKVILTSLEKDTATGKQYIHWQRCTGSYVAASRYGNDSTKNGLNGPAITGMGSGATKVTAAANSAVMFAEVYYNYHGLFGTLFTKNIVFKREAAFIIRDVRNLTTGVTSSSGVTPSSCT
ncbi:TadE/TadG family type IV pilus assembly protein [Novosphingobium lentum]|uniref:TadE/TadG family type IV pilus assembly protein n=1 Tax=Novosphingobium lentum TaxID=145287 RepID=UPI000B061503|nr:pilus assembly protein TadE [Novosphingobium lentum]